MGGGALGHTIAGYLAAKKKYEVSVYTKRANLWRDNLEIHDYEGKIFQGKLHKVSCYPEEVIPDSDMVLICLPGSYIFKELETIKPYLSNKTFLGSVVSSSGFFFMAKKLFKNIKLFGFQRVPFVARVNEYGASSLLLGYRKELNVATLGFSDDNLVKEISEMFDTPTIELSHYLQAALTNSNPILHPSRLYALFKDFSNEVTYSQQYLFYGDWDELSSEILISCDKEFQEITKKIGIYIPSLLEHYESRDEKSLTSKIRSINALKTLKTPMIKVENGFIPDFSNRYFAEDIPYGLIILKAAAVFFEVETPNFDKIILWAQKWMGKEYLVDGKLVGKDLDSSGFMFFDSNVFVK